jgi:hypothetical protein
MKSIMLATATVLILGGTALAGQPAAKNVHKDFRVPTTIGFKSPSTYSNYQLKFGTKFDFGVVYKGQYHNHWSRIYWSPKYGCNIYCCPFTLVEYYWCPWDHCYYPITYRPYGRIVF